MIGEGTEKAVSDEKEQWGFWFRMLNLDDDSLDPFEFRLLGHYQRVCGMNEGVCYEQVSTSARVTKMSRQKVRQAREKLRRIHAITVLKRNGGTTEVRVLDRMEANKKRYNSSPVKNVRPIKNGMGIPLTNLTGEGLQKREGGPVKNDRPPLSNLTDKEHPCQEQPIKNNLLKNTPASGGVSDAGLFVDANGKEGKAGVEKCRAISLAKVESIYEAYPRKVSKAPALKAIEKALVTIGARPEITDPLEWLIERVSAFAASPAGKEGRYTPHPATWFNAMKFDDDPAEWEKSGQRSTPSRAGEYAQPEAGDLKTFDATRER